MNKTISINISGIIFNVNEDAYEVLKQYLEDLYKYFSKTEDGKEVYSDIEGRIAEIFSEIITENNQVITMNDVENVIATLGRVEDLIDSDEELETEEEPQESKSTKKTKKRLYRDPEDGTIAGVAKGLSYYFGIDAVFIRIILILLFAFGGSGLWIYIVLWIAMPEAKTTIQKLEMRGEPINLSNIEKNIKEEFDNVKNNFSNNVYQKNIASFLDKVLGFFIAIFKGLFRAISGFVGFVFMVLGIAFLSVIVSSYLFDTTAIQINEFGIDTFSLRDVLYFISDSSNINFMFFSLLIILTIPILYMLYFGIKLIFGFKFNSKLISIILLMFWIFGIIIFTASAIDIGKDFKYKYRSDAIETNTNIQDTLYVKTNDITSGIESETIVLTEDDLDIIIAGKKIYMKPKIKIIESEEDTVVRVKVFYSSHGRNKIDSKQNLENVEYVWGQNGDTLQFNSHYLVKNKFRGQRIRIKIYKPVNTVLIRDEFYEEF